jgi:hypothetical protein
VLSTDQVSRFHVTGFLAIEEPLLSGQELERLRSLYDVMFAARVGRQDGNQFDLAGADEDGQSEALPQILHPDRYHPEIRGDYLQRIEDLSRLLLGPEARSEIFHAIMKPARNGASTPWHQDEAYWDPSKQYRSISIWMPLQEVFLENGCMWFEDGSHEWDVLEHQSIRGDVRVHGLELVDPSVISRPVACPLPGGGVTVHRNRTAHYAGPNLTDTPRRALIFSAALPDRPFPGKRRFVWNERKQTARSQRAADESMAGAPFAS